VVNEDMAAMGGHLLVGSGQRKSPRLYDIMVVRISLEIENEHRARLFGLRLRLFVSRLTWPRTRLHTGSYFSLKLVKRYSKSWSYM